MTRIKNVRVILPSVFMLVVCVGAPSIFSNAGLSTPALSGTVRTKDGKPLEGVGVSARSSV
jgi:hypothetical protein